ncbi:metallophosphoesterase [Capsulimonas corticalis]|uniref:Metallophosphoesterase n=1 Tax=Capsulimonas corticalis TaxID=2219043 RepID=A0A402D022_9BACT|nr:metallophosphoesterase [Capsulimonas corticalis]BDI33806.1 metallophosphoesterase [Capsulimonas corticalis]
MIDEKAATAAQAQPKSPARRRFLAGIVLAGVTSGATAAYGHAVEEERLTPSETIIRAPGWPAAYEDWRIGVLSDFHCDRPRAVARTQRAVAMLMAMKPDIVFLPGDFVSGHQADSWISPCAEALRPLTQAPGGVYGVLGNHDWKNAHADAVTEGIERVGIHILRNTSLPIPTVPNAYIIGVDDIIAGAANWPQAMRRVPDGAFRFLMVHEPDIADGVGPLGLTLQVSGHSHGGQIRLPGFGPIHTPTMASSYPEGLKQGPHHPVYTTRGVGVMGPQMRLFCPPEVTLLRIVAAPPAV